MRSWDYETKLTCYLETQWVGECTDKFVALYTDIDNNANVCHETVESATAIGT